MADSTTGVVFDIRRFSVHDGPGLRTTVFFKGCPLGCQWCHNPESQHRQPELLYWAERCTKCKSCVNACQEGAIRWDTDHPIIDAGKCTLSGACVENCFADARQIAGRVMTPAEVMSQIQRDIPFYESSSGPDRGGVTFSGGEPLLQPQFLLALLEACKATDIHTALDTSGYARWETIDRIRPLVDLFLYDIKLMDAERHRKYTLVFNRRILENLKRLSELGHHIVIRVPLVPGVNDDLGNLHAIGAFAAALSAVHRLDLLPYHHAAMSKYERLHRTYSLPDLQTPSEERMAEIARLFEGFGLQVRIGG